MGELKQLLPWGDTTVLGQTLRNLQQSDVTDIVVVTGYAARRVAAAITAPGITVIHNPDYARGEMLSSLQTAIRRLSPECEAVLVVLADQPMVSAQTINKLLAVYGAGHETLLAPAYRGQRGNPVLIDRRFFPELLGLSWGQAPRELLRRHPDALRLVEVGTNSVLQDLDRPEDYRRQRPASRPPEEMD